MQNDFKNELHNIISGKSKVRFGTIIQTIASYLENGEKTGAVIENGKHFKSEETKRLASYVSKENLWIENIDFSQYISEGAEQKVYLSDSEHVLKLNDAFITIHGKITFIICYFTIIFFLIQHTNYLDLPKTMKPFMLLYDKISSELLQVRI